jgi:hypothetical protein
LRAGASCPLPLNWMESVIGPQWELLKPQQSATFEGQGVEGVDGSEGDYDDGEEGDGEDDEEDDEKDDEEYDEEDEEDDAEIPSLWPKKEGAGVNRVRFTGPARAKCRFGLKCRDRAACRFTHVDQKGFMVDFEGPVRPAGSQPTKTRVTQPRERRPESARAEGASAGRRNGRDSAPDRQANARAPAAPIDKSFPEALDRYISQLVRKLDAEGGSMLTSKLAVDLPWSFLVQYNR